MSDAAKPATLDDLLAHRRWVRALAVRLASDPNAADDLEQETWLAAMRFPPRRADAPKAWLGTVIRNLARTAHRRGERRERHETAVSPAAPAASPADVVAEAEVQARLVRAVLELDEPYRATVLFRYFHGLAATEIAARTGVPVETVRTRLKRAVAQLRERMGVELGDDRDAWCLLVFGAKWADVRPVAAAASGGAVAAALGGGLAMAATAKIAAAVLVAAGAAWWLWPKDEAPARPTEIAAQPAPKSDPVAVRRETKPRAAVAPEPPAPAASPTADAVGPAPALRGRVVDDETGAPVAKATVVLVCEYARLPDEEPRGVCADDGTFRIAAETPKRFDSVLVRAEGYATSIERSPLRDDQSPASKGGDVELRVYRGARVTGRVLDSDGRTPVAGARIFLSRLGASSGSMWTNCADDWGRADADGRFALARVAPPLGGHPYTLFAVGPSGIGWTKLPGDAGKRDALDLDLRLRARGVVTVTVVDEAGAPQAGRLVVASPRFEPLGPPDVWEADHGAWVREGTGFDAVLSAKTDARGVARFQALPGADGTADLRAVYDFVAFGADGAKAWKDHVWVAAGKEAEATITILRARDWAVAGVVRDAQGAPIAGATVRPNWGPAPMKTDAAGRYRIEKLDPSWERMNFEVAAEGFASVWQEAKADPKKDVELDVVLERALSVEGRVVDQDGHPVAGATVAALRKGASGGSCVTDADGTFRVVAPAGEWSLSLMPPEPYDEWARDDGMPLVHGGDRGVVVTLARVPAGKARLVAEIVDADTGAPLAPQELMVLPTEREGWTSRVSYGKTELGTGRATVERMKTGSWQLWVRVAERPAAVVAFEVKEGAGDVNVRVAIGRPGTLRGRVEVEPGAAMPRFVGIRRDGAWTEPQWGGYRTSKWIGGEGVGEDGSFEFTGLAAGRYRLSIESKGFLGEATADVIAGGVATATVAFTKAAVVSFRLAAASPSEIVVYEVSQDGGPWRHVMRLGGQRGKARPFDCTLKPGAYRWRVSFPADDIHGSARAAAPAAEGDVTVGVGETAVVDVPVGAK